MLVTYVALIQLRGVEPQLIKTTVNRCLFLFCNYFKNISKKVCIYKNKSYLYIIIINK